MWTRNITRVVQVRSSSKIASSPFFKKGEEHNFDRTTSAEEQFVLQKKAIRFERFKDAAFPEKEYEIYSRGGEKSPLATKNKPNWKKYKNWTEAAEDVVFRNLPANVSQHDIMRHHGVKHRKHLNTRYMFDKTMLSKLSNAFPSKYIRDKHVIELYPGFGLLSLRFLRKEPLSYTFVEPDKRVIKSLLNIAQSSRDNGVGVRVVRTEPLDHRLDQLHFAKQRRGLVSNADWESEPDTVVISNTPFWATNMLLLRLVDDVWNREGLFRAGRVPIFMNFHLPVGCDLLGKTSFYGKLVDNFFKCKEIQPVYGSFYTPKMAEGTIWIQLTPRKHFLLEESPEEIGKIIDVIFSSYKDKKSITHPMARTKERIAQRLQNLQELVTPELKTDEFYGEEYHLLDEERKSEIMEEIAIQILNDAEISPGKSLATLNFKDIKKLLEVLKNYKRHENLLEDDHTSPSEKEFVSSSLKFLAEVTKSSEDGKLNQKAIKRLTKLVKMGQAQESKRKIMEHFKSNLEKKEGVPTDLEKKLDLMAITKDDEKLDEIIKDFIDSGGMSLLGDEDFKEDSISTLTMHNWEQGENRSLKQAHRLMKEKYKTRFLTSKPQKRGFKRNKESLAKRY